jgi:hypothetical protein
MASPLRCVLRKSLQNSCRFSARNVGCALKNYCSGRGVFSFGRNCLGKLREPGWRAQSAAAETRCRARRRSPRAGKRSGDGGGEASAVAELAAEPGATAAPTTVGSEGDRARAVTPTVGCRAQRVCRFWWAVRRGPQPGPIINRTFATESSGARLLFQVCFCFLRTAKRYGAIRPHTLTLNCGALRRDEGRCSFSTLWSVLFNSLGRVDRLLAAECWSAAVS